MSVESDPEIARVLSGDATAGNLVFNFEGCEIITQFMRCSTQSDTLIIRFHGSIERTIRPLPSFQANLKQMQGYAHQLSLCDPTMMTREGFTLGWFAGHDGLDVQGILKRFFRQVQQALGIRRMIYLGSSGGGFAALHYSYFDPGSVAVVMVPQTSMNFCYPKSLERYLANCWPGKSYEEVSRLIATDMCDLYAKGHENSVIYLQSSGDYYYNYRHMTRFLNAIYGGGTREDNRFFLVSDFWGRFGHGGAVPPEAYVPWLMTAISAPSLQGDEFLEAFSTVAGKNVVKAAAVRKTAEKTAAGPDEASLRMADLLRDFHLRQPTEG